MFLQYEIIPIIVVGFATIVVGDVATIVVYQTATIVIGIVTIVVLIATIVVDCDNCALDCNNCGHITSPHGLWVENFVHCNCRGAIGQLFQPPAFHQNYVI